MKCPKCNSEEVDAMTPRTVYDCGSSDYDQRPDTFIQSDKCKEKDYVEKLADEYLRKTEYQIPLRKESFIDGYNKAKETLYTEEDMIKCWKYASIDKHQGFGDQIGDNYKSFIQSLKKK